MTVLLVRALGRLACAVSLRTALRLGELLGLVWFHVVRLRRATAIRQLRAAFPDLPARRARATVRRLYRNLGRWAVEFLRLVGPERTRAELQRRVRVEGLERYEAARAGGRGVIVVTGHLGNWDVAVCAETLAGIRLTLLSRRLSDRRLDRWWMERRRALGLEIVDEATPPEELARVLRTGGTVVLVVDQATPPERGGIEAPFFGRSAWTTRLPAMLALRTGAAIVPAWVESAAGSDHVVRVEPPLEVPADGGSVSDRARALTREINERLERRVRATPDQWLWLHRRWKGFQSTVDSPESKDPEDGGPARG